MSIISSTFVQLAEKGKQPNDLKEKQEKFDQLIQ
jgi:hypothetical protein